MLNITKNLDDKKLTVFLEGRLDTTTAPQLEESMKESISDVSELIMDFEKLEYISSAGPVSYTHLTLPTNREV